MQKLIIVPLYIQCETAGGETQCAASLRSTIHAFLQREVQYMRAFLQRAYKRRACPSELSYFLLYWLLSAQA